MAGDDCGGEKETMKSAGIVGAARQRSIGLRGSAAPPLKGGVCGREQIAELGHDAPVWKPAI